MEVYAKRIAVYDHTKKYCNGFPKLCSSIKHSEYDKNEIRKLPKNPLLEPSIAIVEEDSLDALISLIKEGHTPVILNMANESYPGGGVDNGASAQEENIFRRTDYFRTLNPSSGFYPITGSDTIYSKDVIYFKSNEQTGYNIVEPIKISIIASPSVKCPEIDSTGDDFKSGAHRSLQYRKICMIFETAILHGHDSIVLSAYGCGAYSCPSKSVAKLFKNAIELYGPYFKKIVFAIKQPVDHLSKNNYQVFKDVFSD